MNDEHLYVVTYDIANERRWRAICQRRLNSEPPCRLNFEPGLEAFR